MTKQTKTYQHDLTQQDHEINYKGNRRTHPCILIRWRGAPPPAAHAEGPGSPC
jgi:hypothetical protein